MNFKKIVLLIGLLFTVLSSQSFASKKMRLGRVDQFVGKKFTTNINLQDTFFSTFKVVTIDAHDPNTAPYIAFAHSSSSDPIYYIHTCTGGICYDTSAGPEGGIRAYFLEDGSILVMRKGRYIRFFEDKE